MGTCAIATPGHLESVVIPRGTTRVVRDLETLYAAVHGYAGLLTGVWRRLTTEEASAKNLVVFRNLDVAPHDFEIVFNPRTRRFADRNRHYSIEQGYRCRPVLGLVSESDL